MANAAAAASARHGVDVRPVPRLSAPTLEVAPSASSSCPASALCTASSATTASSGGSSCCVLAVAHAGRSNVVTEPLAWPTATQLPAVASATQSGSVSSCAAPHCAGTPSTACTDRLFAVQTTHSAAVAHTSMHETGALAVIVASTGRPAWLASHRRTAPSACPVTSKRAALAPAPSRGVHCGSCSTEGDACGKSRSTRSSGATPAITIAHDTVAAGNPSGTPAQGVAAASASRGRTNMHGSTPSCRAASATNCSGSQPNAATSSRRPPGTPGSGSGGGKGAGPSPARVV
jgi:hypothetical protein